MYILYFLTWITIVGARQQWIWRICSRHLVMWCYSLCFNGWLPSLWGKWPSKLVWEGTSFFSTVHFCIYYYLPNTVDSHNYLAHVTLKHLLFLHFQITAAKYSCPYWFSPGATSLIRRILDPNPRTVSKSTKLFRSSIWIWNNAYHVTSSFQKILITSCSVNYLQSILRNSFKYFILYLFVLMFWYVFENSHIPGQYKNSP